MTLIEFLRARFNDDEATARAAMAREQEGFRVQSDPEIYMHIRRWEPARVLADLESKRMIVDTIVAAAGEPLPEEAQLLGGHVLQALAQPYGEHPDFRANWP